VSDMTPLGRDVDPWIRAAGIWANDPDGEKILDKIPHSREDHGSHGYDY